MVYCCLESWCRTAGGGSWATSPYCINCPHSWSIKLEITSILLIIQQFCQKYCWQHCQKYCWISNIAEYAAILLTILLISNIDGNIADNISGNIVSNIAYSEILLAILLAILLIIQQYCWQYCQQYCPQYGTRSYLWMLYHFAPKGARSEEAST